MRRYRYQLKTEEQKNILVLCGSNFGLILPAEFQVESKKKRSLVFFDSSSVHSTAPFPRALSTYYPWLPHSGPPRRQKYLLEKLWYRPSYGRVLFFKFIWLIFDYIAVKSAALLKLSCRDDSRKVPCHNTDQLSVNKASASKTADSASIPGRVKPRPEK